MENINADVIFLGIFMITALLLVSGVLLYSMIVGSKAGTKQRLDRFKTRFGTSSKKTLATTHSIWSETDGGNIEAALKRIVPNPVELKARLAKTGRKITMGQYALGSLGATLLVTLFLIVIMGQNPFLSVSLGIVGGLGLPHYVIGKMISRRLNTFTSLFPDAIDLIVRGLKSGLPVTESIATVGREIDEPIGVEFRRISDAIRLGKTMEDALWEVTKRIDTPDFKFFVISLAVQKETGGNLAETLGNLSDILRRRQRMKLKIRALSSEGKASAYILGALPFVMFGLLLMLNYDYASVLFTDPRAQVASTIGLVWLSFGGMIIAKMINFEI